MSNSTSIEFGNNRLTTVPGGVTFKSPEGETELKDAVLKLNGDRVTLEGKEQRLTFSPGGAGAVIVDKADQTTYRLDRHGKFHFEVAGYRLQARSSADGTLIMPDREVAPLIPMQTFLPDMKAAEPVGRTRVRPLFQATSLLTSQPWLVGLGVGAAAWLATEFVVGALCGAGAMLGAQLAHQSLENAGYRQESYQLPSLAPVTGGTLEFSVMRGTRPQAGTGKGSSYSLEAVQLRMNNGAALESRGERLRLSAGREERTFEGSRLILEDRTPKIQEGDGHLYKIRPNGELETEHSGAGPAGDFASVYAVLNTGGESPEGELEFKEDEVIIDDFSVPYDHQ